jgi:NADH dehydrogenase I D subunit
MSEEKEERASPEEYGVEWMEREGDNLILNLGPTHPATHGVFRVVTELDGETIVNCDNQIGFLHRCFEKESENTTWTQVIPYTDRLNYVSPLMNNVGYVMAVEKLIGIEVPERAEYIRTIICELSRIWDHLLCIGAALVDLGALTNFWYFWRPREDIYDLVEELTGARLTTCYTRIGGLMADLNEGWIEKARHAIRSAIPQAIRDVDRLVTKNRIFMDRTIGVGPISPENAIAWGFTGPCLRAAGVPYDLRKDQPYLVYDRFDFDIPITDNGDTYDRYLIRMEEMWQSLRILEQAFDQLPGGPVNVENWDVILPPKDEVYENIEALMAHFKLIMEGIKVPPGEVYHATEAANGELGFYIISTGEGTPYKIKVRPPCFAIFSALPEMVKGHMVADLIAVMSSLNIIAGELER